MAAVRRDGARQPVGGLGAAEPAQAYYRTPEVVRVLRRSGGLLALAAVVIGWVLLP